MKKKFLSTLLALTLCLSLLPTSVLAMPSTGGACKYLDENGTERTQSGCTTIYSIDTGTKWSNPQSGSKWYVVGDTDDPTLRDVTVSGDVSLILCDNATLTVNGTIEIKGNASLTIYAQSTNSSMGELTVNKGIISDSGSLTVNGGSITAKEAESNDETWGIRVKSLTVNGGSVIATGGDITLNCSHNNTIPARSLGIFVVTGDLTVTGGTVKATSGTVSAAATDAETSGDVATNSYGLWVRESGLTVKDGASVTANGGSATASTVRSDGAYAYSYGTYVAGKVAVDGAATVLNSSAGAAASTKNGSNGNSYSFGIAGINMEVKSGTVTGTSGNANTYSYGIYVEGLSKNAGNLTISGGSVSGTNGDVAKYSDDPSAGIFAHTLTVSGAATTVTGRGGTTNGTDSKYGICAGTLNVTDGTLTATDSQINAVKATISGGTFHGDTVLSYDYFEKSISGGTFSSLRCVSGNNANTPVAPLLAEGHEFVLSDGTTIVSGSGSTVTSVTNATVQKHEHIFVTNPDSTGTDDAYKCACGATSNKQSVSYIDYVDGKAVTKYCSEYTELKGTMTTQQTKDLSGWYVVKDADVKGEQFQLSGDTHLILCDGAKLTVSSGIVNNTTDNDNSKNLTIYAQSAGDTMGQLVSNGTRGISIQGGTLTINGGDVTATGNEGIHTYKGNLTVHGGKITATGSQAGIYVYRSDSSAGTFTVTGGDITATGGTDPTLSNARYGIECTDLVMSGGKISATGNKPQDDRESYSLYVFEKMTMTGGELTATAGEAKGGIYAESAVISGGTVTATSGTATVTKSDNSQTYAESYGIYYGELAESEMALTVSGGTVTATGDTATLTLDAARDNTNTNEKAASVGIYAKADVTVSAGTVTATGGKAVRNGANNSAYLGIRTYSYGICESYTGYYRKTITVSGGDVTTTAKDTEHSYGVGAVMNNLTVTGGKLTAEAKTENSTGNTTNRMAVYVSHGEMTLGNGMGVTEPSGGAVKQITDLPPYYTVTKGDTPATKAVIEKKAATGDNGSGSGGSSGSSSNTTRTITKNPDGSTTTTTKDKKTGAVTETTKNPNGVTGTVKTDKNGTVTDVSANVPASAVKNGETVTLPIDGVKPSDSGNATEIKVDVPSDGGNSREKPHPRHRGGHCGQGWHGDCHSRFQSHGKRH